MAVGEIHLVRHGEADGADADDPGLSERGREQASLLGARLAGTTVATVLCSPRRRARQTAAVVALPLPGVRVTVSELVDDRTPVPLPSERGEYPQRFLPWLDETSPAEADPGAVALTKSVDALAAEARRLAGSGPLVVVTHAFVIGWFVRSALDAPTWRWLGLHPANASLTTVRYDGDGTATLVRFNDDSHLHRREQGICLA
jgi:probable phosphoglycerate mutase